MTQSRLGQENAVCAPEPREPVNKILDESFTLTRKALDIVNGIAACYLGEEAVKGYDQECECVRDALIAQREDLSAVCNKLGSIAQGLGV